MPSWLQIVLPAVCAALAAASTAAGVMWRYFTQRIDQKDAEIKRLNEARHSDEVLRGDRNDSNVHAVIALATEQKNAMQTMMGDHRP